MFPINYIQNEVFNYIQEREEVTEEAHNKFYRLEKEQSISISGDGEEWDQATLTMQWDGNLALHLHYRDHNSLIWAANTQIEKRGIVRYKDRMRITEMRDGRLNVVEHGIALWGTNNPINSGSYFTLEKSPTTGARIAIYSLSDELVWASDRDEGIDYNPWQFDAAP